MRYLEGKVNRPTYLKTRKIAASWDAATKQRAFFSARVASADLLAVLRKRVMEASAGAGSDQQARELLRMFLAGDGRDLLASLGFSPPSLDGGLAELGSVRRLQLILYQNAKMAQEVGHYQQWSQHWDTHPYGRWRIGYSENHRDEHVARDGMIFRYDHPIWREDPPGGLFNCHCWREELTADQVTGQQIQSADYEYEPSPLQFDPGAGIDQPVPIKPDTPDPIRDEIRKALEQIRAGESASPRSR